MSTSIKATSKHLKRCSSGASHGLLHHFFIFVAGFPICHAQHLPGFVWELLVAQEPWDLFLLVAPVSGGCPSLEQSGHTNSLLHIQQHQFAS